MTRHCFFMLLLLTPISLSPRDSFADDAAKTLELIEAGKFDEAKPIADRLLRQATSLADAWNLNDIGVAFDDQDRYVEAGQLYFRALEIQEKQLGKDHLDTLPLLNNLAILYKKQGLYEKAERYYNQVRDIKDGEEDFDTAVLLNNLAQIYQDQNRFAEAEQLYKNALEIHAKTLDEDDPDLAPPLHNLARLYRDQGRYAESEPLQKRALAIDEKHFGKDHFDTAISLDGLATLYYLQGRYPESEAHFKRVIEIFEKRLGKDHVRMADTMSWLASLYIKQERYDEAEPLFDHAIAVFEKTGPAAHFGQLWYRGRAMLYKATDRTDKAVANLKRAMDLSLEVRKNASGSDEQRAQTFSHYYNLFETMVDWQYELGGITEAYDAMERSRAQSLQDLINSHGIDLLAGLPDETAQKLRQEEGRSQGEVKSLEKQLELLADRKDLNVAQKEAEQEKLLDSLRDARKRLTNAWTAIKTASPSYRLMIAEDRKPIFFDQMRAKLETERTLALQFMVGKEKSYVLVYGHGMEPKLLPLILHENTTAIFGIESGMLNARKIDAILQNEDGDGVLQVVGNREHVGKDGLIEKTTSEKLHALWEILVPDTTLQSKILDGTSFERLLVLPDGSLSKLPFEMLVVSPDPMNPQYLLDQGPIVLYAPSATMYYNLKYLRPVSKENSVLTVGDPHYETKMDSVSQGGIRKQVRSRWAARFGNLARLEWTGRETRWIENACKENGIPVTRFNQKDSTEARVRSNTASRRIVHLACHGLAEDDDGNMFGSLALTVGDASDPKDDGFLTLAEMFSLDLKCCELAVLSACETNLGPNQQGEGTWSMGRGILAAGTRRVVTTDWQVADDAAAHLVYHFINSVKEPKADVVDHALALRAAKRSIRSNRDKPAWRHPHYWAAFVLIGPQ